MKMRRKAIASKHSRNRCRKFDRDFGRGDLGSEDAEQYRKMKAPDVKPEAFPNN